MGRLTNCFFEAKLGPHTFYLIIGNNNKSAKELKKYLKTFSIYISNYNHKGAPNLSLVVSPTVIFHGFLWKILLLGPPFKE